MPAQNRIWSHNSSRLFEHLPSENLAFDRQTTSLIIIEQDALFAELLSDVARPIIFTLRANTIRLQVFDGMVPSGARAKM
jgi:hypothetical protein